MKESQSYTCVQECYYKSEINSYRFPSSEYWRY